MASRRNDSHGSGPPTPRQSHRRGATDENYHLPLSSYAPEPVVFNNSNPTAFEYLAYHALPGRSSIWPDAAVVPLAFGVDAPFGNPEKVPGANPPDLAYGPGPAYMPSAASSVTCLSAVSGESTGESVCSPVLTESTVSDYGRVSLVSVSRGPSPLRNPSGPSATVSHEPIHPRHGHDVNLGNEGFVAQQKLRGLHVCPWDNNVVSKCGKFASREEFNRHIKMEHLLECPILGCTERAFEDREQVACHMKCSHDIDNALKTPTSRTANLSGIGPTPSQDIPMSTPKGKAVMTGADVIEISKTKCRDQLITVLEKRLRRTNGTPRGVDSSTTAKSRTPKLLESASFPVIWEHGVLPFLIEFMPKWSGPGHVISVTRGRKPGYRRICIMTRRTLTKARKIVIASHVRDLLPESYRSAISFVFSTGKVERLVWARGLGESMPDDVCAPRNPFAYISPSMGDSIGTSVDSGDEATATLGPCVTVEWGNYWLACFHPFMRTNWRMSPVVIEHPSPQDRARCTQERHDTIDSLDHRVGELTATSGFDCKTTRITHDPYWEDFDKEPPLVVTDWVLISAGTEQANLLRKFPSGTQRREEPVTYTSAIPPGADVISTGRTSGFQRGQICEVPAYVDGAGNETGKATREWFVEEPFSNDSENEWVRGGIGIEGDSGAAIVDANTNALVGQLWGRNKYWGAGPRYTYFTPIADIFDDVQERCGMSARPKLPQNRDEADRLPVDPVCKKCYDLREYLDSSRRSSRESLMSMVGMCDGRGEHDNDLTSVSELATPKDQSHLLRHLGPDEAAQSLSYAGAVSPATIHAFCPYSQVASPGVSDLRSPYPQALHDDDLYESSCPRTSEIVLGKRPSFLAPPQEAAVHLPDKRRRTS